MTAMKDNTRSLLDAFTEIFGEFDEPALHLVQHCEEYGWTSEEFSAWLGAQPAYREASEFETELQGFLADLGLA
jgi:hypothetical protein